ncbi:MAG: hypothetical protein CSA34_07060 [Desulfobulbus propionicus]|nr:MAG: hypothetical protein CSA34_07060 [Desulfobulbus propionicus]
MEVEQRQLLRKYLDLLLKRWKLLALCLLLTVVAGFVSYLLTTKIYQSEALLSYERQQINPSRMAPEEKRQLQDTVSTLSQLVMSRNNLEAIIFQFSLYEKARERLPIEDVIDVMRKDIAITPARSGDTFTVSYEGVDPDSVMKVVNALAAKFIEENLKYREERATETSKYTENELAIAKERLDGMEQTMRDYKLKHYNEMPEQRPANLNRLNSLHEQYQGIQDSIQNLERTKVMVEEQISLRNRLAAVQTTVDAVGGTTPQISESSDPYVRLQQLQAYLRSLLSKYTDKHPEVRRTKELILRLENELDEQKGGVSGGGTGGRRSEGLGESQEIQGLRLQSKDIDINIKKLRIDQVRINKEIERYQQWIEAVPVREAEWNALTRDYNELRRHYDYLVAQNLQAESVEHLERKQKGSKFKIIDAARRPEKPIKPEFLKMLAVAVAAGLTLGAGVFFLLSFVDTSFKDPMEIENVVEIPVVCSIPLITLQQEKRKRQQMDWLLAIMVVMAWSALLAAVGYAWYRGMIIL